MLPNELILMILDYIDEPLFFWYIFGWETFLEQTHTKLDEVMIVLKHEPPYYLVRGTQKIMSSMHEILCESNDPQVLEDCRKEMVKYANKRFDQWLDNALSTDDWSNRPNNHIDHMGNNSYFVISKNHKQGFEGWELFYPPYIPEYSDEDVFCHESDYEPVNADLQYFTLSPYSLDNFDGLSGLSGDRIIRFTPHKKTYPPEYGLYKPFKYKKGTIYNEEKPFFEKYGLKPIS